MKVKFLSILFFCGVFAFTACDKNDPAPAAGKYAKGVFVVNEGAFPGSGTITYHNPETNETVQDVFGLENDGAALGQNVQSLVFHNGNAYITVTEAHLIYVVDAETFKFIDTIGGLEKPRYFQPIDENTAYVSQWGFDGLTGSLAKVDLKTNKVTKKIAIGNGPEKMLLLNSQLFVANSGGYGTDSTVSIINTNTDAEIARKVVPELNPGDLIVPSFGTDKPVVLCKSYYDLPNPLGWIGGISSSKGQGYTMPQYCDDLVASVDGKNVYFTGGGAVWHYSSTGLEKAFDSSTYGLAIDPTTGYLYCSSNSFTSDGEVVLRKLTGESVKSFPCGVAPGAIVVVQ